MCVSVRGYVQRNCLCEFIHSFLSQVRFDEKQRSRLTRSPIGWKLHADKNGLCKLMNEEGEYNLEVGK